MALAAACALVAVLSLPDPAAVAQSQPPSCPATCTVEASLENDYVVASGSPNAELVVEVFDSPGGGSLYGPETLPTDGAGRAHVALAWPADVDLVAGMVVVMEDVTTSTKKELHLVPLAVGIVDPASDVVGGTAPPGAAVSVEGARGSDAIADQNGEWTVDFAALGYDVDYDDAFTAEVFDDDGDGTIVEGGVSVSEVPPCPPGSVCTQPPCIETSTTICGTAGPDTIRFSRGDVFSGGESDTLILKVGTATGDVVMDPGTAGAGLAAPIAGNDQAGDGFIVDIAPAASRRWSKTDAAAPSVVVDGRASNFLLGLLPSRPDQLVVRMLGSSGADLVSALGAASDVRGASPGGYRLFGRGGIDFLDGGNGHDRLRGGRGDDWLSGNNGRDLLIGGRGDDFLDGGRGFDVCYVGPDDATFGCEKIVERRNH